MCGIAGISSAFVLNDVTCFDGVLSHRGPDDHGEFWDEGKGLWLRHDRLAIIDTSKLGKQPMVSADERFVIVFNGEIYNHKHLRNRLSELGYKFESTSDTEVLLYLYSEYGKKFLEMLDGIFAVAIWNTDAETLFVARDALGVKPLYYQEINDRFIFGSELKALKALNSSKIEINVNSLRDYLLYSHAPGQSTPAVGWNKLQPGHAMIVCKGKVLRQWAWYSPARFYPFKVKFDDEKIISKTRDLLRSAVERQLVSDVRVGAFLSGGVDSSSIVCFAKDTFPNISCYTTRIKDVDGYQQDEDLKYAQFVASEFNLPITVVDVSADDFIQNYDKIVWHLDEPIADPACLTMVKISQQASIDGCKVLLSGTGGDDLFAGYRRHKALLLGQIFERLPTVCQNIVYAAARNEVGKQLIPRRIKKMIESWGFFPDISAKSFLFKINPNLLNQLVLPKHKQLFQLHNPIYQSAYLENFSNLMSELDRALVMEQRFYLGDQLLCYTDKLSMMCGVEVRVPFLDRELVEFTASLPDRYKIRHWNEKWVLKEAMRGFLPNNLLHRPKMGFGIPLRKWFAGSLNDFVFETLSNERIKDLGVFDSKEISRFLNKQRTEQWEGADVVLSLMLIHSWHAKFCSK